MNRTCRTAHPDGPLTAEAVSTRLRRLADRRRAAVLRRFFKTGPGGYAEGDRFLGVPVPIIRKAVAPFRAMPLEQAAALLRGRYHEQRLAVLLILAHQFARGDEPHRRRIFDFCLSHTRFINKWDLVDLAAPHIVGAYLAAGRDRSLLVRLARSPDMWERRLAMVATLYFIRRGQFAATFRIARMLLDDREDLIHKAAGWMLREAGRRNTAALVRFLDRHAASMPRTMLRYAVERLEEPLRRRYMALRAARPRAQRREQRGRGICAGRRYPRAAARGRESAPCVGGRQGVPSSPDDKRAS